jgi:hypothetical protein
MLKNPYPFPRKLLAHGYAASEWNSVEPIQASAVCWVADRIDPALLDTFSHVDFDLGFDPSRPNESQFRRLLRLHDRQFRHLRRRDFMAGYGWLNAWRDNAADPNAWVHPWLAAWPGVRCYLPPFSKGEDTYLVFLLWRNRAEPYPDRSRVVGGRFDVDPEELDWLQDL